MGTKFDTVIKIETEKSNKIFTSYFFGINLMFILLSVVLYKMGNIFYLQHVWYNLIVLAFLLIPLKVFMIKIDKPQFFKYLLFIVYTFYITSLVILNNKVDTFSLIMLLTLNIFAVVYMSKKLYLFSTIYIVILTVFSSYFWNLYITEYDIYLISNPYIVAFYRGILVLFISWGGYIALGRIMYLIKAFLDDNVNVFIDDLTGAYNKYYLEERLSNIPFKGNIQLSIISLGIDNMKDINAKYGFSSGDAILHDFADNIKNLVRESDSVCRIEGDKFTIIVQHPKEFEVKKLAKRIKHSLDNSTINVVNKLNKHEEIKISASYGVASLKEGENSDSLLQRAEKALQLAKKNGKNRIEISS